MTTPPIDDSTYEGMPFSSEPSEQCTPLEALLWDTANELGVFLEMILTEDQFEPVAAESIEALGGVDAYFSKIGVLRPQSVVLVLHRLRRHKAGVAEG